MKEKQNGHGNDNSSKLQANIELAMKAKEYARNLIKGSATALQDPVPTTLVASMRKFVFDLDVSLKMLLRVSRLDHTTSVYYIKDSVARVKKFSLGNCGEYSFLALNYLRKQDVHLAEQFCIQGDDHAFVVIGRDVGSLENDPKTWGPSAVICDPWADKVYSASDIMSNILCFKRENGVNQTYPFDPNIHSFVTNISIGSNDRIKISREFFKIEAIEKINAIFSALDNSDIVLSPDGAKKGFSEEKELIIEEINSSEYGQKNPERMFSKMVLRFLKTARSFIKNDDDLNKFGSNIVNLLFRTTTHGDCFLLKKKFEIIRQCHDTVALSFITNMKTDEIARLVEERRERIGSILVYLLLERQDAKFAALVRNLSFESWSKVEKESTLRNGDTPIKMLHAVALNGLKKSFNELVNNHSQELLNQIVSKVISGRTLPEMVLSNLGIDSFLHLLNKLSQQEAEDAVQTLATTDEQSVINLFNEKINKLQGNKQLFINALAFYAYEKGLWLIFKNLVDNHDVNIDEPLHSLNATLIFMAAQNGHIDIVKFLLAKKCSQLIPFTSSETSLQNFSLYRGGEVIDRMNKFIKFKLDNGSVATAIPMLPQDIAYVMNNNEILIELEINLIREIIQKKIRETTNNDNCTFKYSDIVHVASTYNQDSIKAIKEELEREGFTVEHLNNSMQITAPQNIDRNCDTLIYANLLPLSIDIMKKNIKEFQSVSDEYRLKLKKDLKKYYNIDDDKLQGDELETHDELSQLTFKKYKIIDSACKQLTNKDKTYYERMQEFNNIMTDRAKVDILSKRRDSLLVEFAKIAFSLGSILVYRWVMNYQVTEGARHAKFFKEKYDLLVDQDPAAPEVDNSNGGV